METDIERCERILNDELTSLEALKAKREELDHLIRSQEDNVRNAENDFNRFIVDLSLKWGRIKSITTGTSEEAKRLYDELSSSIGSRDEGLSEKEKNIIYKLIDMCHKDLIYIHYTGEYVSKQEAKDYVKNYFSPC